MKSLLKKILTRILIPLSAIFAVCFCVNYFYMPPSKQEINIGDSIKGYRIMNSIYSFTNLISIEQTEGNYQLKFIQYYDNNPYEYTYILNKEDYLFLYSKKLPGTKTKLKIIINNDNKTITLENEELLKNKKPKKSK